MFDYMLVDLITKVAYCIGTKVYCMEYQLKHGVRATSAIAYVPENTHTT